MFKFRFFTQPKLTYNKGCDYLQTRVRLPRKVLPNIALYCDWIIWDKKTRYIDSNITPRLIYVRSDIQALNYFSKRVLKKIRSDFVLVTSSHDLPMPLGFHRKYKFDWEAIVNNRYLKAWFTENRDIIHEKIQAIPLGLPHPDLRSWVSNSVEDPIWDTESIKQIDTLRNKERIFRVFGCWRPRVDHSSGTCPEDDNERQQAYDYFIAKNNIFDWHEPVLSHRQFMEKMGEYQFVLCPHGGGLDPNPKCWEALIMKAIPIVRKNTMSESLEHLPVVIVDNWSEVTLDNMEAWKEEYVIRLNDSKLEYKMSNSFYIQKMLEYLK